jgi:PadR family transcriptional regulator, regulatory protein PadR
MQPHVRLRELCEMLASPTFASWGMVGNMHPEALRGHIDTMVLAALRSRPAHGYALVGELAAGSDGVFELGEGTVYPALHRLERAGLVESSWVKHAGRRRRIYALTGAGEKALGDRDRDWRLFARGMNALLEGST